ncbi:MAG: hypothetical protein ACM3X8_05430 [Methanomicrobiales archaeon]
MNARFGKILISILCGALLLIAGCTTPAPTGGGTNPVSTTQVQAANPDLGSIIALLRSVDSQVAVIAANTKSGTTGLRTDHVVLFDAQGNAANAITFGSSVVSLPGGSCDIAIFANEVQMFTTIEEIKDYSSTIYSRNKQTCLDVHLCRKTVNLDGDFSYLYVTYKPYRDSDRLSQVTLSYRCGSS